ncbi:hypothetical protein GCM10007036_45860 [Alsobacter metallidurans]|uniref:DUF429 domain-containing protein n=1 Tax=Alsobacter metallidurans TaxID=340221 RepID=A0A917IBD8_9HYPH|nr:DUF429 domain-containing protein [Alsobacter metallidurans]GGH33326.1 hypothetical protein GCM10007036_45860 [Alsobacter metallidurans]
MARWLAGVDGCKGGWVAAVRAPRAAGPTIEVFARFADLLDQLPADAIVAVDMPIGLPERIGPGGRGPEALLRPLLGERQSSVFSVPSRSAVSAPDYAAACAAALATSDPPRKVSKQCFFLFSKMLEIDALLRADPALRTRVFESHPEGAFMRLNGGPLTEPKKVKSQAYGPGLEQRRALLESAGLARSLLAARPPRGAGADDVLDACACLVTAIRLERGEASSLPAQPAFDAHGIPVAIWM